MAENTQAKPAASAAVKPGTIKMIALANIHLRYEKAYEKDEKGNKTSERLLDANGKPAFELVKIAPGELFDATQAEYNTYVHGGAAREANYREVENGGVLSQEQFEADLVKAQNHARDMANANPEGASKSAVSMPNQDTTLKANES